MHKWRSLRPDGRGIPESFFLPFAQCPMPNAQCPMPNAQCPMP
ncbi:histidine kinase [aff. Roholtiella sp. LEGE 12411]|nr:histidine kinase [aff. Roholtiella sp. LEGE 12411]